MHSGPPGAGGPGTQSVGVGGSELPVDRSTSQPPARRPGRCRNRRRRRRYSRPRRRSSLAAASACSPSPPRPPEATSSIAVAATTACLLAVHFSAVTVATASRHRDRWRRARSTSPPAARRRRRRVAAGPPLPSESRVSQPQTFKLPVTVDPAEARFAGGTRTRLGRKLGLAASGPGPALRGGTAPAGVSRCHNPPSSAVGRGPGDSDGPGRVPGRLAAAAARRTPPGWSLRGPGDAGARVHLTCHSTGLFGHRVTGSPRIPSRRRADPALHQATAVLSEYVSANHEP